MSINFLSATFILFKQKIQLHSVFKQSKKSKIQEITVLAKHVHMENIAC